MNELTRQRGTKLPEPDLLEPLTSYGSKPPEAPVPQQSVHAIIADDSPELLLLPVKGRTVRMQCGIDGIGFAVEGGIVAVERDMAPSRIEAESGRCDHGYDA